MREHIKRFLAWIRQAPQQFYTPRELRAIVAFLGLGVGVLAYRHGKEMLLSAAPELRSSADSASLAAQDSLFFALSREADRKDSLFFSLPEDSLLPIAMRRKSEHHSKEESLRLGAISLNKSLKEDLIRLPTVGPATAELILEYRSQRGRFRSIDELTNVHGFSVKRLARVRRFLRLD